MTHILTLLQKHIFLVVVLSITAISAVLQFSVSWFVGGDDGIRHIAYANLWRTEGYNAVANYPFLPYSILHTQPTDPWFGFHALLIPFTKLGTLLGLKIYNIVIAGIFAFVSFKLFKIYHIKNPAIWTLILSLGSSIFFFRLGLGRPLAIGHIFLLLAFIAIHKRSYISLAIIGIFFALLHQIFPVYLFIIGLSACSLFYINRNWRVPLLIIGSSILGVIIGILLHPESLNYLRVVALMGSMLGASSHLFPTGQELQPLNIFEYVLNFGVIIPVWVLSVWSVIRYFRTNETMLQNAFLSTIFFLSVFYSQRFLDYFWMTAIITLALVTTHLLEHNEQIKTLFATIKNRNAKFGGALFMMIVISFFGAYQWAHINTTEMEPWKEASKKVSEIAKTDEIIYNASWDSFPFLFYFNPHNRYVTAFDPFFLYAASHERYFKWWHIGAGDALVCGKEHCNEGESIEFTIKNEFMSNLIMLENKKHSNLKEYLDKHKETVSKSFDNGLVSVYLLK